MEPEPSCVWTADDILRNGPWHDGTGSYMLRSRWWYAKKWTIRYRVWCLNSERGHASGDYRWGNNSALICLSSPNCDTNSQKRPMLFVSRTIGEFNRRIFSNHNFLFQVFQWRTSESLVRRVWRWCCWAANRSCQTRPCPSRQVPFNRYSWRCPFHLAAKIQQICPSRGKRHPSSWRISPPQSQRATSILRRTLPSTYGSKSAMGVSSGTFLHHPLPIWKCGSRPRRNDHHLGMLQSSRNA